MEDNNTYSNWVKGDKAYVNLDKFMEVIVRPVDDGFIVIGLYVNRGGSFDEVGIKMYKYKDDALAWVKSVLGAME